MKAFIQRETGILGLTENFAFLREISRDGYYVYEVKYKIDPIRAIQSKALTVKIHVSTVPYNRNETPIFSDLNAAQAIRNILTRAADSKDQSRTFETNYIVSIRSDITKKIPNDATTRILNSSINDRTPIKITKELRLAQVSELNEQNILAPIFQTNLYRRNELSYNDVSSFGIGELSQELIYNNSIDPANFVGSRSNLIAGASSVIGGIYRAPSTATADGTRNQILLDSLLSNSGQEKSTQNNLSPDEFVPVMVENSSNFIEINEEIKIPARSIQRDEFFFIFQLVDGNGIDLETINSTINHSRNLSILNLPRIPPTVSFLPTNRIGRSVLLIKQEDPYAIGVSVYRKIIDRNANVLDAQYNFVGKINLRKGEDFKKVEDVIPNLNPVIYRVIPFNESGVHSGEFTSVIPKSENLPAIFKRKLKNKKKFASLSYDAQDNGILIEVRETPVGPIGFFLLRKDLTIFDKTPTQIGNFTSLNNRGGFSIKFLDTSVKKNHVYEYYLKFLYRDGDDEISTNKMTVEYIPISNNVVDTKVGKPTIRQNGPAIDVLFTIESSLIETNIDFVRRALTEQGLADIFQEDIINNKEKLQNLLGYRIVRTNMITGEIEDFGIVIDANFSDRRVGVVKGVKPVENGYEYKYTISTHFRSPETLLENFTREIETSANNTYTLTPSKWLHPITLNQGNIVSARSLMRNHSKSDFTFGAIGSITNTFVSLTSTIPSLFDAVAKRAGNKTNLVEWKIQGEVNKIDHFIIILEILGMKTIVGKCHNISDSNQFQFIDPLDAGEHGSLSYHIVPVFYDYSRGTAVKTNRIIV